MSKDEILKKLKEGWNLTNRGLGWYLAAPRVPHSRSESFALEDSIVDELIEQKFIKVDVPYVSAVATLV